MTTQQKGTLVSSFDIDTPEIYSFKETLIYLSRSPLECLHKVKNDKIYKLLELEGEKVLIEISEKMDGKLQVTFLNQVPSSFKQVQLFIEDWLDLSQDLTPFYEMAKTDALLSPLVSDFFGLRVIGVPDLFEAICWAVIGQQVNLTFAYTVKKRLVETYGDDLSWRGERYWVFPKPEEISKLTVEDLKQIQLTGRKAEYLIQIATLMKEGNLSKQALLETDFESAEKELVSIRGIGPWSAHYVLMRCLRDPSAFPIGDAGLQNALKQLLGLDTKPTYEEMTKLFSKWKGWEAYAVFYLWRSLSKNVS
ncbi:DNA-3-methyladenine glycosylase 2 [Pseudalkalibacillus berkeleyi]|uniref:DNA-3-methyladenine glycosylase II n=1 Tax=Pseudalkalibacillus berkeleyi TaxID=1069813 RepID=A0ABS9H440_9BACL|nr:DNA-3-methyladenine glycosylase 2 [Pseudalkalibacillus berkeleyi]MCF6138648.1 DNA glycosylase [Pseudalkalibacillus berkeleyi]